MPSFPVEYVITGNAAVPVYSACTPCSTWVKATAVTTVSPQLTIAGHISDILMYISICLTWTSAYRQVYKNDTMYFTFSNAWMMQRICRDLHQTPVNPRKRMRHDNRLFLSNIAPVYWRIGRHKIQPFVLRTSDLLIPKENYVRPARRSFLFLFGPNDGRVDRTRAF